MQTLSPPNHYVDLATRCYRRIEQLAQPLGSETMGHVPGAVMGFWSRLAWADQDLALPEQAIFHSIFPDADPLDAPADDRELEALMGAVAEHDEVSGTRLGRQFASQFESFGYAVLAADRVITDAELATLQVAMRRLYGSLAYMA